MAESWQVKQEEEDHYRLKLFAKAKKGDAKGTTELQHTYGARIWSPQEIAQLEYVNTKFKEKPTTRKRAKR